jgi:hypothetical protein
MRRRLRKKLGKKRIDQKIQALASCLLSKGISREALPFYLYICDFEAYRILGRSITGASWMKTESGPVPVYPKEKW